MKAANVFQIEQALDQPITPQQRQTAAANNPVAALIAQRLDGLENSFRTKMQTPPPPQGTVMNQYYQWPQQQMAPMGLAQPGLEELAQQYAAGGLVAFSEGGYADGDSDGDLYDVDGSEGYSGGGDVRGYFGGHGVWLGEDEYDQSVADEPSVGDVGSGVYGLTPHQIAKDKRAEEIIADREEAKNRIERSRQNLDISAGPGDILGTDKLKAAWEDRQLRKAQEAEDYYKTTTPPPSRAHAEQPAAVEPSFWDKGARIADAFGQLLANTPDEGDKLKQQLAEKAAKHQAEVDAKEKPGTSVLSPAAWNAAGLPSMLAGYEDAPDVPRTQGLRQPGEAPVQPSTVVITDPEHRDTITRITSPEAGLSADQQIAALAKYFQTDTSEAMRIKGEMERDNAKANNLDMFAAMMGAIGLGIGTNAPRGQQWGAGLAGLASGLAGAGKQADARQGKLDELALKIKEMEGSGTRKAAEMVLGARAKAAAEDAELKKALAVAGVNARGRKEAAQISAAGKGDSAELKRQELGIKVIDEIQKDIPAEPGSKKWRDIRETRLQAYIAQNPTMADILKGVIGSGGSTGSSGTQRSMGSFVGGRFTPYG